MTTAAVSPQSSNPNTDSSAVHSYGAVSRANDIEVLLPTTLTADPPLLHNPNNNNESESVISNDFKPAKAPCLKPYQSETVFAVFLFLLGLGLLIYVVVSYWFTHSQMSPIIISICGLLCFIPGCYYLYDHYCCCYPFQRNRRRHVRVIDHDDII